MVEFGNKIKTFVNSTKFWHSDDSGYAYNYKIF